MVSSGIIKETHCGGAVTSSIEWSAEENIIDGTITFTANAYIDNTKQNNTPYISAKTSYSKYLYLGYYGGSTGTSFQTIKSVQLPYGSITTKGKHLMATLTCTIPSSESDIDRVFRFMYRTSDDTTINGYNAPWLDCEGTITISIKRTSTMNISGNHTLGIENVLEVTKAQDINEFTHSVTYKCGTKSGTICDKSSATNLRFTLDEALSTENTAGTTVDVTFTIDTYYKGEMVKDVSISTTKTYVIPESVKPSCTIQITDSEWLTDKYGGFVQRKSRFQIVVTPVLAYNSPIVKYKVTANGLEYDTAEVTTKLIKNSGENEITVTLTDERGRSETFVETVDVLPYELPVVSDIHINRCDENGIEQKSGNEYIKVTFDAAITPLNNKNKASYMISYQKISGLQQVDTKLTDYTGVYSVVGGTFIFAADTSSAYEITVSATDDFSTGSSTRGGSTATTIFNILASGLGLCFGANATVENAVENTFLTYPSGGFMFPKFEGTTIATPLTPNVYMVESGRDVGGSPTENPFILIVLPFNKDDLLYIVIDDDLNIYISKLVNSAFSEWDKIALASTVPNKGFVSDSVLYMQRYEGSGTPTNLFEVNLPKSGE